MKRALKIFAWTLAGIIVTVVAVVCIAIYLVFTPERLTPIARQLADKYVVCDHEIGEVDLTFFSTFPCFGASVKDVVIINPVTGAQSDTVLAVPELVVALDLMNAIKGDIYIKQCRLKDAQANIYIAADGLTNYNVLALPESEETPEEDTLSNEGWQLNSFGWDEDLIVSARTLTFVDEKDTISASLQNASISVAGLEKDTLIGALLDVKAEHIYASLKGETYANDLNIRLHLPALFNNVEHVYINGTELQINEFGLSLDGEVGTPCLQSGEYNMDLTLHTGKWDIESLLALVPAQFTQALADLSIAGTIQLEADVKGQYTQTLLPRVQAHVRLRDGEGAYKPLPYELKDIELDANADLRLNKGEQSAVTLHHLSATTKQTSFSAKGQVDDVLGDMLMDVALKLDAHLPDFAYFLPKNMTLQGRTRGTADVRMRLSDLTNMRLEKGRINADLTLTDIHYAQDSMVADLPKTHALIQIPNKQPSKPKVNWARIDLTTDKVDFQMATPLTAALKQTAIMVETGNVLSDDPVLYAALDLQTEQPIAASMDSMSVTIDAPTLKAYAEYNTKDTMVIPVLQAQLAYNALNGYFKDIHADLKASQIEAAISGGRKDKTVPVLRAKLNTDAVQAQIGNELSAKTGALSIKAASRYNPKGENILLQWNPLLNIDLKGGELNMPERLPETVKIPSIEFAYSNREMTIQNSRVELGRSDLNLKGNVRHIGKWFRHEAILEGELDVVSDHCDANQLMAWFSADSGSEEKEPVTNSPEPKAESQEQKAESEPFLVPTDVDLALKTHVREVEIFNQVAKDLKGGLYVKNGEVILDEMGFVCRAAKMQLTAMYKSPWRDDLYVGFDYHMIDIDIDELLSMIPDLEEMVPMLSSFKGAAQFHLAVETYLNEKYQPKISTLRGAASLTGKDLVVLDGKTFSKISKLLLFKKKTENKIDSINAEITVYKDQIDVYPLCVQMDKYTVAMGGRHRTDMTFDYDINVLSPIYLGVHVGGDLDNLKIKLAKCKYAKDFRPHWYQKADTQSLEMRKIIKESMEKNVRIQ
jgi:uncharacterized protein involved in outer membrane biogenesis